MKRILSILSLFSLTLLASTSFADAQEITPAGEQVSIKWGNVSEENGLRKV